MTTESIRNYCLSLPNAKESLQWGDNLCFKVNKKIFTILGLDSVPQRLCFKCDPETFAQLCEHEDIRPAPYLGRYKWVMLDRLDVLPESELQDLIRQSYEMVSANAAGKKKAAKKKTPTKRTGKPKSRRKTVS